MSEIENGSYDLSQISSGVSYITNGYLEYAQEVICGRALPSLYDGLKPVHRRILETLRTSKAKGYTKSARIAGNTMSLHPHGDASIYQSMVLMTQKNGSLAFPLIDGSGSFGGVYTDDVPAASRYTEARLHDNANEYFGEMNGIEMIPNFDSTMMEPSVFPVSFPAVLVNSTSGIAVGFRSNIPSFNFNDVCDLVIEYIKDGACHTAIAPDFVTGGYYIKNEKELQKIMRGGVGRIKLRGKHVVDGKQIIVTDIPFGKTIQKLVKSINDLNSGAITNAYDTDDFEHDELFTVICSSKARVDEAIYQIYKDTDYQYTFSADITVVKDGAPIRLGVWGIIEEWVKWRRQVLIKEYTFRADACRQAMRESKAFMTIVNDYDKRMELVRIIADSGRNAGKKFIEDNFSREDIPADLIDFCASRSLPTYHDGGKYANEYERSRLELESLEANIANVDDVIVAQMNALKVRYGSKLQRRTEITNKDYIFSEEEGGLTSEKIVDTSSCFYEFKDGFLKKLRYATGIQGLDAVIEGNANDTLIAFDNRGRLLRVYCQDIPLCGAGSMGEYLPTYFGLDESDDYKICWIGKLTGQTLMLIYKDGNVGFVDTSEWIGNSRNVKVLQKGISVASAPTLGAVVEDIPEVLMVTDTSGRIAWEYTANIKRKDRTARTRVFDLVRNNPLDSYACLTTVESITLLSNIDNYYGKLKPLSDASDFRGDGSEFVNM